MCTAAAAAAAPADVAASAAALAAAAATAAVLLERYVVFRKEVENLARFTRPMSCLCST